MLNKIKTSSQWFGGQALYPLLVFSLALMLMFNWVELYRPLVYLNLFVVAALGWRHLLKTRNDAVKTLYLVIAFPLAFTILHLLATANLDIVKDVRQLWAAAFIALGVWFLARHYLVFMHRYLQPMLVGVLLIYTLLQVFYLLVLSRPYGTTSNPHYLALYSCIALPLSFFLICRIKGWLRGLLLLTCLALAYLVLTTSSRPAWIALIVSTCLTVFLLRDRQRVKAMLAILLIPAMLFLTNLSGFGSRMSDLIENINHEERVVIWQDSWRMQTEATPVSWLIGHGIGSFRADFQNYSNYHGQVEFSSPHNIFLDVLYSSGLIGLVLLIIFCSMLYSGFIRQFTHHADQRMVSRLMVFSLTFSFLFISITISTYSHHNLYVLGFISGTLLYLREVKSTQS